MGKFNSMKQNLDAAILAGGKSSRMKTNKAVLELGGRKLIEHVVDAVKAVVEKPMIISNTPPVFSFLGLPIFPDIIKNIGPLGGIYTALKRGEFGHCLVVACDLPFITPELFRYLIEQERNYDVLAVDAGRGVEPLCAIYSRDGLKVMKEQIDAGQNKVADYYGKVDIKILKISPRHNLYHPKLFFNVNDATDYQEAQRVSKEKG